MAVFYAWLVAVAWLTSPASSHPAENPASIKHDYTTATSEDPLSTLPYIPPSYTPKPTEFTESFTTLKSTTTLRNDLQPKSHKDRNNLSLQDFERVVTREQSQPAIEKAISSLTNHANSTKRLDENKVFTVENDRLSGADSYKEHQQKEDASSHGISDNASKSSKISRFNLEDPRFQELIIKDQISKPSITSQPKFTREILNQTQIDEINSVKKLNEAVSQRIPKESRQESATTILDSSPPKESKLKLKRGTQSYPTFSQISPQARGESRSFFLPNTEDAAGERHFQTNPTDNQQPSQDLYGHETIQGRSTPFDFAYHVEDQHSGAQYGHNSNSDGTVTTGEYRVLLPDGRTQIVTYIADPHEGFNAKVRFEGEVQPYEPLVDDPPVYRTNTASLERDQRPQKFAQNKFVNARGTSFESERFFNELDPLQNTYRPPAFSAPFGQAFGAANLHSPQQSGKPKPLFGHFDSNDRRQSHVRTETRQTAYQPPEPQLDYQQPGVQQNFQQPDDHQVSQNHEIPLNYQQPNVQQGSQTIEIPLEYQQPNDHQVSQPPVISLNNQQPGSQNIYQQNEIQQIYQQPKIPQRHRQPQIQPDFTLPQIQHTNQKPNTVQGSKQSAIHRNNKQSSSVQGSLQPDIQQSHQPSANPYGTKQPKIKYPKPEVQQSYQKPDVQQGYQQPDLQSYQQDEIQNSYQQPRIQQSYQQPELQQTYQQPEIQSGNQQPEVQQGYQQPEISQDYHQPNIQQDFQHPDVQQGYNEPEIQEGYHQPNIHQDFQQPDIQKGKKPLEISQGYQQPEIPQGYQQPEIPQGYQQPEIPQGYQQPEIPQGYQQPEIPQGYQQLEISEGYQQPEIKEHFRPSAVLGEFSSAPPHHQPDHPSSHQGPNVHDSDEQLRPQLEFPPSIPQQGHQNLNFQSSFLGDGTRPSLQTSKPTFGSGRPHQQPDAPQRYQEPVIPHDFHGLVQTNYQGQELQQINPGPVQPNNYIQDLRQSEEASKFSHDDSFHQSIHRFRPELDSKRTHHPIYEPPQDQERYQQPHANGPDETESKYQQPGFRNENPNRPLHSNQISPKARTRLNHSKLNSKKSQRITTEHEEDVPHQIQDVFSQPDPRQKFSQPELATGVRKHVIDQFSQGPENVESLERQTLSPQYAYRNFKLRSNAEQKESQLSSAGFSEGGYLQPSLKFPGQESSYRQASARLHSNEVSKPSTRGKPEEINLSYQPNYHELTFNQPDFKETYQPPQAESTYQRPETPQKSQTPLFDSTDQQPSNHEVNQPFDLNLEYLQPKSSRPSQRPEQAYELHVQKYQPLAAQPVNGQQANLNAFHDPKLQRDDRGLTLGHDVNSTPPSSKDYNFFEGGDVSASNKPSFHNSVLALEPEIFALQPAVRQLDILPIVTSYPGDNSKGLDHSA
ncbi:mediator of RNA polymerase II transcription subunit 12-like [Hyalella azteca]|uniref:Mediator of RNA polymerase II transcription subunit 12-like n=1 Tax=Hyalella azteca TaxID=294128 RepID=A0A8B7PIZ8_HYAAZ|nr:mediator of RNA polymerase II transcription subunit 12-like [Hyalella azteca]